MKYDRQKRLNALTIRIHFHSLFQIYSTTPVKVKRPYASDL